MTDPMPACASGEAASQWPLYAVPCMRGIHEQSAMASAFKHGIQAQGEDPDRRYPFVGTRNRSGLGFGRWVDLFEGCIVQGLVHLADGRSLSRH